MDDAIQSTRVAKKTGRRPIATHSGMEIKFPIPMNSVGYVRRSVTLAASCGGYKCMRTGATAPRADVQRTEKAP